MQATDMPAFLADLNRMAALFCDELSKERIRLYWELFCDGTSLEEWAFACLQVMRSEVFHKVPLPGAIMPHVHAFRAERARREAAEAARQREEARLIARAERLVLEASPEWQAAEAKRRDEETQRQQEYQEWLGRQSRSVLIALGKVNPPNPARWRPLGEDELAYVPSEDPAIAKQRLRSQFRQLMEEEA